MSPNAQTTHRNSEGIPSASSNTRANSIEGKSVTPAYNAQRIARAAGAQRIAQATNAQRVASASNAPLSHKPTFRQRLHCLRHKPNPKPITVYDVVLRYDAKHDFLSVETSDKTASTPIMNARKRIEGFDPNKSMLLCTVTEYDGLSRRGVPELTYKAEYPESDKEVPNSTKPKQRG